MPIVLHASDIASFQPRPKAPFIANKPAAAIDEAMYFHPSVGSIYSKPLFTPYMKATTMRCETLDDMELHNVETPDSVNINFFMAGHLDTHFSGLGHDLNMRPGYHNLVYSPSGQSINWIGRKQTMEMLHISLDKDFYLSCLSIQDAWSERIANDLSRSRPCSGRRETLPSTPHMLRLIDSIRHDQTARPIQNLLVQSRVLELVALQMEQFGTPTPTHEEMRPDEAEKLHELRKYLDANFLSELSLTQLSRICLLNEFKVKRGFKLLFGTTVFNYLRKLRMEYAGNLLRHGGYSVDEVAAVLGYEHAQHFSVAFKKYTGVSPSQYQRSSKALSVRP
ncbi:AraC family transcriptional regulator [Rhabdobacter roseus]|uniref:AraC-like DNA-binding protein n=1 Tax=Rhabdobacter roseus TaxID=1655419 RepID=A0A840TY02_9BACT|nr:AraC family transcriptional regulator [Rhabdobacter roseus]MBB5286163.1 AraC-like DNA-binding protein [Rhabdobacter roseus]